MAGVTNIQTTGDNDEPIFPVRFINHYMYCDHCGSFNLGFCESPEDHEHLRAQQKQADRVAKGALVASLVSLPLSFVGFFPILALSLLGFAGAKGISYWFGSRIEIVGLQCGECGTKYLYGSPFFREVDRNPRGYTMSDVPRPLYTVYQIKGPIIEDDPRN